MDLVAFMHLLGYFLCLFMVFLQFSPFLLELPVELLPAAVCLDDLLASGSWCLAFYEPPRALGWPFGSSYFAEA